VKEEGYLPVAVRDLGLDRGGDGVETAFSKIFIGCFL
jgi:hypothetical protein